MKEKMIRNGVGTTCTTINKAAVEILCIRIIHALSRRGRIVYTMCNQYVKRPSTYTHHLRQFYYLDRNTMYILSECGQYGLRK